MSERAIRLTFLIVLFSIIGGLYLTLNWLSSHWGFSVFVVVVVVALGYAAYEESTEGTLQANLRLARLEWQALGQRCAFWRRSPSRRPPPFEVPPEQ